MEKPPVPADPVPAGEGKVGSLYVVGDTIYEFCGYSAANTKRFADAMTKCADKLAGKADVYSLIAPKAWNFYLTDAQKKKTGCKDEKAMHTFHRFSILVWVIWLIPFVLGMMMGMH